jgi:hypothetical protein
LPEGFELQRGRFVKLELAEHLNRVRVAVTEVDRILARHKHADDSRTVMVIGLLATIIQYHRSILLLLSSGAARSAVALIRDIVDGMYIGLWINTCATPVQIQRIKTEEQFPVNLPEIIKAVDIAFFEDMKNRCGTPLYKSNRSGIIQLGHWLLDSDVGLQHDERELCEVTTVATSCILLLAGTVLSNQNHVADCKEVEALSTIYDKRAESAFH